MISGPIPSPWATVIAVFFVDIWVETTKLAGFGGQEQGKDRSCSSVRTGDDTSARVKRLLIKDLKIRKGTGTPAPFSWSQRASGVQEGGSLAGKDSSDEFVTVSRSHTFPEREV